MNIKLLSLAVSANLITTVNPSVNLLTTISQTYREEKLITKELDFLKQYEGIENWYQFLMPNKLKIKITSITYYNMYQMWLRPANGTKAKDEVATKYLEQYFRTKPVTGDGGRDDRDYYRSALGVVLMMPEMHILIDKSIRSESDTWDMGKIIANNRLFVIKTNRILNRFEINILI